MRKKPRDLIQRYPRHCHPGRTGMSQGVWRDTVKACPACGCSGAGLHTFDRLAAVLDHIGACGDLPGLFEQRKKLLANWDYGPSLSPRSCAEINPSAPQIHSSPSEFQHCARPRGCPSESMPSECRSRKRSLRCRRSWRPSVRCGRGRKGNATRQLLPRRPPNSGCGR
jgi:hypothetical protein